MTMIPTLTITKARTRHLAAAKRSMKLIAEAVAKHQEALEAKQVPEDDFTASVAKYFKALDAVHLLDALSAYPPPPEDGEPENGLAEVRVDDLAALTAVIRADYPGLAVTGDSPLARLTAFLNPGEPADGSAGLRPSVSSWQDPVPDADARAETCALCGAIPGQPCTYVHDKWAGSRLSYREGYIVRRAGLPMPGVHRQRRDAARSRRARAWRRGAEVPVHPASQAQRAAARAERDWDLREYARLRDWLADNWQILVYAAHPKRPDRNISEQEKTS